MQNDDLGQFPTPSSGTGLINQTPTPETITPITPPNFEATPDEIQPTPTVIPATDPESSPKKETWMPDQVRHDNLEVAPVKGRDGEAERGSTQPTPATLPSPITSPNSSLLTLALIIIAGIGITGSVFLYSQSSALKRQLTDITQTLERQKTIITPSPTPSIIEIPEPSPIATTSSDTVQRDTVTPSVLTPTASPTAMIAKTVMPIALAPQALSVGINHQPNAQLILIKTENAQDPATSLIKYFFRQDLTTKKYFYVSVNSKNESEIVDKAIYVNPDNNIPTLNDLVLGNKLGIDFNEAYDITIKLCPQDICKAASVKAQFIKSGDKTIWQLSLTPTDTTKGALVIQIDSKTKEVLFKSANF